MNLLLTGVLLHGPRHTLMCSHDAKASIYGTVARKAKDLAQVIDGERDMDDLSK